MTRPTRPRVFRTLVLVAAVTLGAGAGPTSGQALRPTEPPAVDTVQESADPVAWVTRIGGKNREWAHALAVDGAGNSYAVGHFKGETTIGMAGGGAIGLRSAGGTDVFVAKLDPAGRPLWARRFGGPSDDEARGVAVTSTGLVYATGFFTGSVRLDANQELASAGSSDAFLLQLDPDGRQNWVRAFGGAHGDVGYKVAALPDGGAAVTGYFQQTAAAHPAREGEPELTSAGIADGFVLRFAPDSTLRWARRFGGKGEDQGRAIAVAADGGLAVGAGFEATARFGEAVLTSAGRADAAWWRLDADGTPRAARRFGGTEQDSLESLAASGDGGWYLAGSFFGKAAFGDTELESAGTLDVFAARLTADGDVVWARSLGGTGTDLAFSILALPASSGAEGALVAGFASVPSADAEVPGQARPILVQLDAEGTPRDRSGARPSATVQPLAIALGPGGALHLLGSYKGETTFPFVTPPLEVPAAGKFDVFLAKVPWSPGG